VIDFFVKEDFYMFERFEKGKWVGREGFCIARAESSHRACM